MKRIKWDISPEHAKIVGKIVDRIEQELPFHKMYSDRQDAIMDIMAVHCNGTPLRLRELLTADDFNFCHDIYGIHRHLDRSTGQLNDHFLPRFAA